MKEIVGELWDFHRREDFKICITTNGTVKKNGECVMGRGCAAEAAKKYPYLPKEIGKFLLREGNHVGVFWDILTFPVKHNWWEKADLELIANSAKELTLYMEHNGGRMVLPRPGCGNGRLDWEREVRPVIESILPDNVWVISKK